MVALVWNTHRIRKSKNQTTVSERHFLLYTAPERYNKSDCMCIMDEGKLLVSKEECTFKRDIVPCDETIYEMCQAAMKDLQLEMPKNSADAVEVYCLFREYILEFF